jgi:hypothetical protein
MSGSKRNPLIIGRQKKPRCFGATDLRTFNVEYTFNSNAWMTQIIFEKWLLDFNCEMVTAKRKILLLVDNVASHSCINLSNIEIMFLPKNTTPILQPHDMGIIRAFKSYYDGFLMDNLIENKEGDISNVLNGITILDAIYVCSKSWDKISIDCIRNCFRKALCEPANCTMCVKELNNTDVDIELECVVREDLMDEEGTDFDEYKIKESVTGIYEVLSHLKEYVVDFSPENIIEFYKFKDISMKNLKSKYNLGTKITDFIKKD